MSNADVKFLQCEDFDRFRESLRGWDADPTQLTTGRLTLHWDQIIFDNLTISRLRTNRKISDRSAYHADHFAFVVCLASEIVCGMSVPAGSLVVFGPGREYRNILQDNWESFEILMSSQLFLSMEFAESVSRRIALGPERSVMPLSESLVASFKQWSANFLSPFQAQDNLASDPFWSGTVRERTLALLRAAVYENGNVGIGIHPLNHVNGWGLASRALAYIDANEHQRLSVSELCKMLECTPRALQHSFQITLGVTPLQYMLARRLHLAKQELLSIRDEEPSITRVAASRGFLHFGRFSNYYQCLFGELPSSTVKRARMIKSA